MDQHTTYAITMPDDHWRVIEQYDTRKPKPAKGKTPAFEPNKTGVVIIDASQPNGFYGDVVSGYSELREVWKKWRTEKKMATCTGVVVAKASD